MIINHIFTDADIEGVAEDYINLGDDKIEILIVSGTEAILIHKEDVIALARHFKLIPDV